MLWIKTVVHTTTAGIEPVSGILPLCGINGYEVCDSEDFNNFLENKEVYFDYIEDLIERENAFTMEQFASSVNEFLAFRRYDILPDKGRISAAAAKKKAEAEYDAFNKTQRIVSDFDREVQRLIEFEKRP